MIKDKKTGYLFATTDYCIKEVTSGKDVLTMTVVASSEDAVRLVNEMTLVETAETNSEFVVKSLDGDDEVLTVEAELNLDDFKSEIFVGFSKTGKPFDILNAVVPAGWTVEDHTAFAKSKTIELDGPTAVAVADSVVSVFGVAIRYDFERHQQHVYDPSTFEPTGEYLTKELNLVSLSRFSNSKGLINRLYARGKNGLTFADVNGGKDYIEDTSYLSGKVVADFVKDERFESAEALLAYTKQALAERSKPRESYECRPVDIGSEDAKYAFLKLDLLSVVTLLDVDAERRVDHQVVERTRYPYDATRNELVLSTVVQTLTGETGYVSEQLTNPNSSFNQQLKGEMDRIASTIIQASGGHVVINTGSDGKMAEILVMDTNDKATAKDVMRINLNGIAFSTSGYNGPFNGALSLSGEWFAQFIATWKLTAGNIVAGKLQDRRGKSYWDLDSGKLALNGKLENEFNSTTGLYISRVNGAIYSVFHGDFRRVDLFATQGEREQTTGRLALYQGRVDDKAELLDADARATALTSTQLEVGRTRDDVYEGWVRTGELRVTKDITCAREFSDMVVTETLSCAGQVSAESLSCQGLQVDANKIAVGIYGSDLTRAHWAPIKTADGRTATVLTRVD